MKHILIIVLLLSLFACKSTSSDDESYPCPVYDEDLQNIEGITETDEYGNIGDNIDDRDWHFGEEKFSAFAKPVEINDFSVELINDTIFVKWTTESETNNSGWNIFRSQEDIFELAEKINPSLIDGAGTSIESVEYTFIDQIEFLPGYLYYYWLQSVEQSGNKQEYGPVEFFAEQFFYTVGPAYPNPSTDWVKIRYSLANDGKVTIIIIDEKGKLVTTLVSDEREKGDYEVVWHPEEIESGIYRCIYHVNEDYHWHGDIIIQ